VKAGGNVKILCEGARRSEEASARMLKEIRQRPTKEQSKVRSSLWHTLSGKARGRVCYDGSHYG
jgi:hypothetical protein